MKMVRNIPVRGEHEEKTLVQIKTYAATADRTAPDGRWAPGLCGADRRVVTCKDDQPFTRGL